jgi:hypothetical protein
MRRTPSKKVLALSFSEAALLGMVSTAALAEPMAVSLGGLVNFVIYVLILAAVVWLLLFIIAKAEPPEPFSKILPMIVYIVAALLLIAMLLSFAGMPVVNVGR